MVSKETDRRERRMFSLSDEEVCQLACHKKPCEGLRCASFSLFMEISKKTAEKTLDKVQEII
jgi:hypothetical protein